MSAPEHWEVRPMRAGDVEKVFELERRTEGAAHWGEEEYMRILEPAVPRGVQRMGAVAVARGHVVGFATGRHVLGESEIENVAVDERFRRKGVAAAMIQSLLAECRRRKALLVRLEVRESNLAAQALYRNAGFVVEGRRDGYYRSPDEAAVVLARKL